MKYIMTEFGPIIFAFPIAHTDMLKLGFDIESAGFCDITCTAVKGESLGLGIKSSPSDLEAIQFAASIK